MIVSLFVFSLFMSASKTVRKICVGATLVLIACLVTPFSSWAEEIHGPMPETQVTLPKAQAVVNEDKEPVSKLQSEKPGECQNSLINQDLEARYAEIQKGLENDYSKGLPKKLRQQLLALRSENDKLSAQLFDLGTKDPQEINNIVVLTIDNLEKMIALLPKVNNLAPKMRDSYVVPFTNISSIKAEQQDCLMAAAIKDIKDNGNADKPADQMSGNIYRNLTNELKQLNNDLYTLQTSDVQKFIAFRAELLEKLEKYNKTPEKEFKIVTQVPKVVNLVHTEIEKLLPGLQLSEKYYSIAH